MAYHGRVSKNAVLETRSPIVIDHIVLDSTLLTVEHLSNPSLNQSVVLPKIYIVVVTTPVDPPVVPLSWLLNDSFLFLEY